MKTDVDDVSFRSSPVSASRTRRFHNLKPGARPGPNADERQGAQAKFYKKPVDFFFAPNLKVNYQGSTPQLIRVDVL